MLINMSPRVFLIKYGIGGDNRPDDKTNDSIKATPDGIRPVCTWSMEKRLAHR